jgi:hypothetical protein
MIHYWLVGVLLATALSCSLHVASHSEVPTARIPSDFMLKASLPVIYAGESSAALVGENR